MQCTGTTQRAAFNFHARLLSHEASSSEAVLDPDVDVQRQAACLLLASKVHEEPLRLRDMVNSVHHLRGEGVLSDSRRYWEQKEALVREEQLLLRALSFDTSTGQPPSALLMAYLSVMRAASPLCELSCALLNDSAGQPSLSHLASSPNLLAASVIHLASSLLRTPIQARAHMQTCPRAHVYTCPRVHVHMHMHSCTHALMHACTHARMHACTHARMHACTHARMHIQSCCLLQAPRWWVAFDVEEANLVATCHLLLDMYAAQPREANGGPAEAQGSAAEGCAGSSAPPAQHASASSNTAEDGAAVQAHHRLP
jgi:hypothetical protein